MIFLFYRVLTLYFYGLPCNYYGKSYYHGKLYYCIYSLALNRGKLRQLPLDFHAINASTNIYKYKKILVMLIHFVISMLMSIYAWMFDTKLVGYEWLRIKWFGFNLLKTENVSSVLPAYYSDVFRRLNYSTTQYESSARHFVLSHFAERTFSSGLAFLQNFREIFDLVAY